MTATVAAADTPPAVAAPWSARGWRRAEVAEVTELARSAGLQVETYVNPGHGLRLAVPAGWTVANEERFSPKYLWVMGRVAPDGAERLVVNIAHRRDVAGATAEDVFQAELEGLRSATVTAGGEARPLTQIERAGPTEEQPGVYEIRHTLVHDGSRSHQLIFVRAGVGYVVTRKAAADASADELVELELVRQSMGLR